MRPGAIILQVPGPSSVLQAKRIFRNSIHRLGRYVRFHCRDNRLKGDRCRYRSGRCRLSAAAIASRFSASGEQPMLLSRALSLATVMLLVGCCTMGQVEAQENLEAGKSPSQIFGGTCAACHKSPRGLLKTVPPGSLAAFLRQHYTTSPQMAGVLASYLISNGATATRYGGGAQAKGGKDAKSGARPASASEAPAALGEIAGHNRKRLARPAEAPDAVKPAAEGQPAEAATEHGPDDRKLSAKQG